MGINKIDLGASSHPSALPGSLQPPPPTHTHTILIREARIQIFLVVIKILQPQLKIFQIFSLIAYSKNVTWNFSLVKSIVIILIIWPSLLTLTSLTLSSALTSTSNLSPVSVVIVNFILVFFPETFSLLTPIFLVQMPRSQFYLSEYGTWVTTRVERLPVYALKWNYPTQWKQHKIFSFVFRKEHLKHHNEQ